MTRTGPQQGAEKIHALTSLRFFAALFVVFYHVTAEFVPGVVNEKALLSVIRLGFISVSFFFLLSGYILGVVYLRRGGAVPMASFYKARFARVYPLFFLTLVLDTPFLLMSRWAAYGAKMAVLKTGATFAANTLMLQAWVQGLRGIDNPNWSLSVETLFYLVFPLVGVLLWKLRGASLWIVAAVFYVAGQGAVYLAAPHLGLERTEFQPLLHLTTFAIGILVARWQALQQSAGGSARRSWLAPWIVSGLAAVCFCAVVYWSQRIPKSSLCDGLLAPIFAAAIWAFSHSEWWPARVLSARWLVVLGEASFGLYLFHIPLLHLFEFLGWHHTAALFPVYLGLAIGISVLSFFYFETPMRRWILKSGRTVHVKETMEMASDAQ